MALARSGAATAWMVALSLTFLPPVGADAADTDDIAALRDAAAAGDADAMLRLGTAYDFGLEVPRDPARAMLWFLDAADAGSATGMFNIATMLDFGVGRGPRDPAAASVWYGRAALAGHARARYNLGLLYEKGEGVPRNHQLAAYWYQASASDIPDATARLSALSSEPGATALPTADLQFVAASGETVDMVWTAAPGPVGQQFVAEVWIASADGTRDLRRMVTEGSAAAFPLASSARATAARVLTRDPQSAQFSASGWTLLGDDPAAPPDGMVQIGVATKDADGWRLARSLADGLQAGGIGAQIVAVTPEAAAVTHVNFGFDADRALAEDVAQFLPGSVVAKKTPLSSDSFPGQVTVLLHGGNGN